jgi:hypothetical protein
LVARSRHKNAVELNRCRNPYGIVIHPALLDEKICAGLGGESQSMGVVSGSGNLGDRVAPWP